MGGIFTEPLSTHIVYGVGPETKGDVGVDVRHLLGKALQIFFRSLFWHIVIFEYVKNAAGRVMIVNQLMHGLKHILVFKIYAAYFVKMSDQLFYQHIGVFVLHQSDFYAASEHCAFKSLVILALFLQLIINLFELLTELFGLFLNKYLRK